MSSGLDSRGHVPGVRIDSHGLGIDRETATPDTGIPRQASYRHRERIACDHALMVATTSWDSGDIRPEAGPRWTHSQMALSSGRTSTIG